MQNVFDVRMVVCRCCETLLLLMMMTMTSKRNRRHWIAAANLFLASSVLALNKECRKMARHSYVMQHNGTMEKKIYVYDLIVIISPTRFLRHKLWSKRWLFLNSKEKTNDNYSQWLPHRSDVERIKRNVTIVTAYPWQSQNFMWFDVCVCIYVYF